jgi:hypothetical protein
MGIGGFLGHSLSVDDWSIGLAEMELEDLLGQEGTAGVPTVTPRVRWLPKPWFVRYWADPCLLEHQGRLFLYYEEVLVGSGKGRLRWTELAADGTAMHRGAPMISLRQHASYPYVFTHSEAFYCVPETGTSNRVALYKSDTPLGPWKLQHILLEGVPARDSTVFHFDDRWWLFCTVAGTDTHALWANLHIWHAPEPWGPWEPHRLQPAKKDIHSSRPAGRPFTVDGVLYRPAQDCWPRYGVRTVINRVLTLTPDDFAEEVCSSIEPDPLGPYGERLHTISSAGGLLVIDGNQLRPTLNPYKVVMEVALKIRRRLPSRTRAV